MDDLEIIRQRLVAHAIASPDRLAAKESLAEQAGQALASCREDGSWADIDYGDRERAHWQPAQHLQRMLWMLRAAHRAHNGALIEQLFGGAQRALSCWLARQPESDNWWHNDIGAPSEIGQILLLFGERIRPAEREQALQIMARVKIGMTGQNRAWVATIAFLRGALIVDEALMRQALDEVLALVQVTDAPEGIQPDWSFHQHGPQLYQGNYGAHFPETVAPYVTWLRGTRLEMPADKVEALCRLLLDGTQWMTWGSLMDYHTVGRFITSPLRSRWESRALIAPCAHLSEAAPAHHNELLAFRDRLLEERPRWAGAPVGNRHFWRSDFMVQRRGDFYISIRMSSTRTAPSEACNREGLRNYHLGDGVTLFLRDGQEYVDIFPVWDWRRLPGVTCRRSDEPLPVLPTGRERGTGVFVGGVSDRRDGLAAMDLDRAGVQARKAWFCCENVIVCLGAGISSASGDPIQTSLNQSLLRGAIHYSTGGRRRALRERQLFTKELAWAHHGGFGYLLLDEASATLSQARQSGSWHLINGNMADEAVEKEVFSLWLDHGRDPQGASYAYAAASGIALERMPGWARRPGFEVLANSSSLQAVRFGLLTEAAFRQPGALELGDDRTARVDHPCLLMLRRTNWGYRLSLAEPTQLETQMAVTLGGRYVGRGCCYVESSDETVVTIKLPSGGRAGATVTRRLHSVL